MVAMVRSAALTLSSITVAGKPNPKPAKAQPAIPSDRSSNTPSISRSTLLKSGMVLSGALVGTSAMATLTPPDALAITQGVAVAAAAASTPGLALTDPQTLSQVMLTTLSDCKLAVSVYPTFSYNASGGGGGGKVTTQSDGLLHVEWDAASLSIPPITYATSSVLGIPIPPPLKIAIIPKKLHGTINPETGEANLEFLAGFEFTAGPLYTAPPLVVSTTLTTEESVGELRSGTGKRLTGDGHGVLVGVARVPKTGDGFLDTFLMLPTDALAVLSAEMKFS